MNDLQERLLAVFDPTEIKWKPGKVSGNRCLALCYIDARCVMDRLDDVLGVGYWQDEYIVLNPSSVLCKLTCCIEGNWITKSDVGSTSEQPDEGDQMKAAFSDALKRAAVKFGIGRYLYSLGMFWTDFDPQTKKITKLPDLPTWAKPPERKAPPPDKDVRAGTIKRLEGAAEIGMECLAGEWKKLSNEEKKSVADVWESIKRRAAQAKKEGNHAVAGV